MKINPKRTITLIGEITEEATKAFLESFWALEFSKGPIYIRMCSAGGMENCGWGIYDAISVSKNETYIIGYGEVMSIAVLIFQAAKNRILAPNCRLMIHYGSSSMSEVVPSHEAIARGKEQEYQDARYVAALADSAQLTIGDKRPSNSRVRSMCKHETYFSAEEAIQYGLADDFLY